MPHPPKPSPATTGTRASGRDTTYEDLPPEGRAALRGGVVGNYVDQLHIFLPLVALAPALGTLAGPHATAGTGALVVLAMLLGRPVGGMIFGAIADRWGRTRTTRLAIAGTAACSFGIAAVPSHEVIGPLAITLVLLLRFVGGVFIAGEYSAAIPLAMEWSRPRRRGLFSGLIMSMAPWAQATIAFVTGVLLVVLGQDAYAAWGWRMSFVAGGLASVAMLIYYRRNVTDAPVFRAAQRVEGEGSAGAGGQGGGVARPRLVEVMFGWYRSAFWTMFGLMTGLWFLTQMTVIALPGWLREQVGLDATQVSWAMGIAAVGQAIVMSLTGHLSTLTGRRRFYLLWGTLAAFAGPAVFWWTIGQRDLALVAVGAVVLQAVTVTAYGPIGAYLSERLTTAVRSTGYGTAYSLSIVVPALFPFYLPPLQEIFGDLAPVLAMIVLGGVIVVICAAIGPALRPEDLEGDVEEVARRATAGQPA
ncbi:MFS transporter [Ornithinimicrobium sp. Y1847]|uniref:MFS transporter n=1 Tax=Ornithinimicrobium sp. Y1847 TaxID=3405419 RepID=UPI003B66D77A